MASWEETTIPEEEKTLWEVKRQMIRNNAPKQAFRAFKARLGGWLFVYPWKISKISSWVNENKYQLLIIKHKKEERERARERAHWSEEVAAWPRNKSINPTRKCQGERQRYKYSTTSYSFEVADPQEIPERGNLVMGKPYDHIFFWQVGPTWQPLISNFNSMNLAYLMSLINPE
jgi:hypothetical protein